jgi:hypothetical protein
MNKPNWVCVGCGMWSSRKYSVKRHISNVHNGFSMMVSFTEYVVGRQTGIYLPPIPAAPAVGRDIKSREPYRSAQDRMFSIGFWKEMGRDAARKKIQRRW